MKITMTRSTIGLGASVAFFATVALTGGVDKASATPMPLQGAGGPPNPGDPIRGLTSAELTRFTDGATTFANVEGPLDGLGPVFNARSCGECHKQGALGGSSPNLTVARVTRIGGIEKGVYSDLASVGGPVLQARSLREFDPKYPYPGEVIPPEAKFVSFRITTPLFGAGLVEAIPDAAILARARPQPDGVQGVPNMVVNLITGKTEVGRFGWKAQHSNLSVFAGDAYLNEMGITTPLFPHENLPQGKPIVQGADLVPDPEDDGTDVKKFGDFMRMLSPIAPLQPTRSAQHGSDVFAQTGCVVCHTPSMRTGTSTISALANRQVDLYSDLLLHRMGPALQDGIEQGNAKGDMFKTAPLWGLRLRKFYLHDGRATTLDAAIRTHGGEASRAVGRYAALRPEDRQSLIDFLMSL